MWLIKKKKNLFKYFNKLSNFNHLPICLLLLLYVSIVSYQVIEQLCYLANKRFSIAN